MDMNMDTLRILLRSIDLWVGNSSRLRRHDRQEKRMGLAWLGVRAMCVCFDYVVILHVSFPLRQMPFKSRQVG